MSDNFFDKYDLYTEGNSSYYYKGTCVLKNKYGIKDIQKFKEAEAEVAFAGLLELQLNPIKGNFDREHLYAIHKFLFEPFYTFAGKTRREDISKGNTKFCVWQYIEDQLDELFKKLHSKRAYINSRESVVDFLSYAMAELNIIHPFREGNGRTIREFIRQYALELGYKIDWSKVSKDQLLIAMIESVLDKSNLEKCIDICML